MNDENCRCGSGNAIMERSADSEAGSMVVLEYKVRFAVGINAYTLMSNFYLKKEESLQNTSKL